MYNQKILQELLSTVKGKVFKNFNLGKLTFFKAGGNAEYLFIPQDLADLQYFLAQKEQNVPVFILGAGSNLLVRDGGIKGVTVKLNNFNKIKLQNENTIFAESGALDKNVALFAKNNGVAGLEFLYTIPGTIGGALTMNAGAYGSEIKDIFVSATALDLKGQIHNLNLIEANFSYRSSYFKNNNNLILLGVLFKGIGNENSKLIFNKMNKMEEQRMLSQPKASERTGGSTFKNPLDFKAWELINKVGGAELKVGGASVSGKHCNFLINNGTATAKDIESLGELIRDKVKEKFNITLEWEIKVVGEMH